MRSRSPLDVLITGAVVGLAFALVVMLLTSGHDAGRAATPVNRPTVAAMNSVPKPVARPVTDPLIEADFADPDMIKVGGTYYAYATNAGQHNVQVAKAPAAEGPWTVLNDDALPALGVWAETGMTWAPEVLPRPDGTYLLYYTARAVKPARRQCIGAAVATSPTGPFSPVGTAPLVCPRGGGDTIDAAAFTDTDGRGYLLYRSGSGVRGRPTAIFIMRMAPNGLTPQSRAVRILTWDGIEPRLVEAPALVRKDGRYYLFYANGDWRNATYRTGYATAPSIAGPYKRAPEPLLSTERFANKVVGPGGADILHEDSGERLVFHGVLSSTPYRRGMYVTDLGWANGRPVVRGLPERYEAEAGRLVAAQSRKDLEGASAGRAVGYFDNPASTLELRVFAPSAGPYSLRIRHANRSAEPAKHELTVNGAAANSVDYAPGRAESWAEVTVNTVLSAGWSTLRIRRIAGQVDLDYVELI